MRLLELNQNKLEDSTMFRSFLNDTFAETFLFLI